MNDPGGMEGWVGHGTTSASKQSAQDRCATAITVRFVLSWRCRLTICVTRPSRWCALSWYARNTWSCRHNSFPAPPRDFSISWRRIPKRPPTLPTQATGLCHAAAVRVIKFNRIIIDLLLLLLADLLIIRILFFVGLNILWNGKCIFI